MKETGPAMDKQEYQLLLDTLQEENMAVLVATINRSPAVFNKNIFMVGLRRAGGSKLPKDNIHAIDLSKIAEWLKSNAQDAGFVNGGGHPYAAAAHRPLVL